MIAQPPFVQARRVRGFTLVELLVSMVLLSMVMVGLLSVMRTMAQAQDRVEHRIEAVDDFRVASAFVESVLGRVSARRSSRVLQLGESPYQFSARSQELIWVGAMPARFGMGGRSYFRLALENREGSNSLVLRFVPWDGAANLPDWGGGESYEVAHSVTSLAMSYEDAWHAVPQWVPLWSRTDGLPARVRIDLTTSSGQWPMWIVPMRQMPAGQSGGSRFSLGGGAT